MGSGVAQRVRKLPCLTEAKVSFSVSIRACLGCIVSPVNPVHTLIPCSVISTQEGEIKVYLTLSNVLLHQYKLQMC
jgi:hypothetical protein